ncbi:Hypothetical protein LEPBI_Ia1093 [Leptospira biflexa serovar Patoc strain 'Patoc 1 (Paris)']|uniref:Uncharacterized protein n=1 Tax=Leptospira biflexa serovar Patoc (strain Patoc 1 / ATCC 23582 / Paris) TaxID=456481 RepID=B0SN29_LEPBP|nr:Hypothetical protein LEPBI_Ia1093 [Leptospira biflexa serovar Patoc strain 'Patoc 1 (Paris)']
MKVFPNESTIICPFIRKEWKASLCETSFLKPKLNKVYPSPLIGGVPNAKKNSYILLFQCKFRMFVPLLFGGMFKTKHSVSFPLDRKFGPTRN